MGQEEGIQDTHGGEIESHLFLQWSRVRLLGHRPRYVTGAPRVVDYHELFALLRRVRDLGALSEDVTEGGEILQVGVHYVD